MNYIRSIFQCTFISEHFSVDVFATIYTISIANLLTKLASLHLLIKDFSEGKVIDYTEHLIAEHISPFLGCPHFKQIFSISYAKFQKFHPLPPLIRRVQTMPFWIPSNFSLVQEAFINVSSK